MENHLSGIRANNTRDNHAFAERGVGVIAHRRSAAGRIGAWLVLFAVLMCTVAVKAGSLSVKLQGESNPNTGWISGGLSGWGELDFVPMRLDITGGPATSQTFTVDFPRFGTGTVPGIEDLYNWSVSTNVVIVSGPTLTVSTGSTWTYSITVNITNSAEADIYFFARLAAGSHAFGGNSLSIGGTPSSMGQCQIAKPSVGNGVPDLGITKTGPSLANAGSVVTYSLTYTNSTNNAAVGVQIVDTLPTGSSFVSASVPVTTNGSIIVCDLGVVDKSAVGVVSFTIQFSSGYVSGAKITNNVTIATSDNDTNAANNSSSWITTIVTGCVPATIGSQPQSVSACTGSSATIFVGANGQAPLSYQWYKNGSAISNATSSAYMIASVSTNDVASYSVIVTNGCGSVSSSAATILLNQTTTAAGPSDSNVCPGSTATFSTTASGTGPFTYLWKKNGVNMTGQINGSVTLTNVTAVDTATYSVVVTGTCNSVTNSALLTVNTPATSSGLTSITNNCSGTVAAFTEAVSGTGPFAYVWRKNGSVISGQTNSSYVIAATALGDTGTYVVEVTGSCNSITNSATLAVSTGTFGTALTNLVLCPGNSASFSTVASGAGPFFYQWRKNGGNISGQTTSVYNIGSVSITDAGTYSVEIGGNCNKITNSATLAVNTPLSGGSFSGQTVCAGQSATFTTVPAGSAPFTYVWKKDGVVQGSTSNSLTVVAATTGDAGTYTVEVYGPCNSTTNSAILTVNSTTTASALISLTNCPGQSATFSTVASGTGPFTYAWKKDGIVQSSTSSSLTVASASSGDAGIYTVVVTGACNSVTNSATLAVNAATTSTILNNLTNCAGQSVAFTTVASGTGPFTYVWKKGGVVQGSTSNILSIASVSAADAGSYSVEVTGTCNSVTNTATLTVNDLTTASALTPVTTCAGQSASFSTTASGAGPFVYVWKKNGVNLGNNSSALTIGSTTTADSGTYTVEVSGVCNSVTNSATLTVNALTAATAMSTQTICAGQSATFTTVASGTGPFAYVWTKDGVVQSSTSSALTVPSATTPDAGTYTVVVTGTCNSVTNTATLTVNSLTTASGLTPVTTCEGQSASFSTTASGTGPLVYVWKKNGVNLGNTSSALTIGSTTTSDSGTYTVEVSGACNSVTNSATLTVNALTTASVLTPLTRCEGQSASFSTTATGTGPFAYVWKKNG
ncbi:MAG: beta strand repeat-containing protein, partial [Limisphaerales bacterium]